MAKKMRAEGGHREVSAEDLRNGLTDINKLKDSASEASGLAGKRTQQLCDQFGLEKTALTITARLDRMEPAKQQNIIRSTIEYWHKAGFFDQIDAFDDTLDRLEQIISEARDGGSEPTPKGDGVVESMTH